MLSNVNELLDQALCPNCDQNDFKIIFKSKIPTEISKEELLKIYRSSSDHTFIEQMVQCKKCDLVYLNPRIKQSIILESYINAVDPTFISQNETRIKTFSRSLSRIMRKTKLLGSSKNKILDVGCAGGAFPKAAADMGFDVYGIEPSQWLCEFARTQYSLKIKQGILKSGDFNKNTFDLITLWDVIEHLTDPKDVLRTIHDILKDDGFLVVNYPDIDSLACKILGKRWPFYLSVHLIYFTPMTIKKILEDCGFIIEQIEPYFQTLKLGYILKRAATYFPFFSFLEKLVNKVRLSEIPFTYNIGQSMVIARKAKGFK